MSGHASGEARAQNWATFAAVPFLGVYPDGVVIYALTVYGESLEPS